MSFHDSEQAIIAAALRALATGDGKRFDDLLWLGLGDRCADAYVFLETKGLIETPNSITSIRLTTRGRSALDRLTAHLDARDATRVA